MALIEKVEESSVGVVLRTEFMLRYMPALAIRMSMWVTLWVVVRAAMVVWGSVGTELSILMIKSLESGDRGRVDKDSEEGDVGSRTAAMTVVEGWSKREATRPRPIPGRVSRSFIFSKTHHRKFHKRMKLMGVGRLTSVRAGH